LDGGTGHNTILFASTPAGDLDKLPASPRLVVKPERPPVVTGRLTARAQPKTDPTTKH
jgi:hypothetical protein